MKNSRLTLRKSSRKSPRKHPRKSYRKASRKSSRKSYRKKPRKSYRKSNLKKTRKSSQKSSRANIYGGMDNIQTATPHPAPAPARPPISWFEALERVRPTRPMPHPDYVHSPPQNFEPEPEEEAAAEKTAAVEEARLQGENEEREAEELPEGWKIWESIARPGHKYYWNTRSGYSQSKVPTGPAE